MKHSLRSLGLVAALPAAWASAQHAGHPHPEPAPKAEVRTAQAPALAPASTKRPASPFAGYRPFDPDEPRVDWKAANEAVRAAGGHMGLMKSQSQAQEKEKKP